MKAAEETPYEPNCSSSGRAACGASARTGVRLVRSLFGSRSEEHTSELQSLAYLVCRLLLEKKKKLQHRSYPLLHPWVTDFSKRPFSFASTHCAPSTAGHLVADCVPNHSRL